jgi:hypothetical protein
MYDFFLGRFPCENQAGKCQGRKLYTFAVGRHGEVKRSWSERKTCHGRPFAAPQESRLWKWRECQL